MSSLNIQNIQTYIIVFKLSIFQCYVKNKILIKIRCVHYKNLKKRLCKLIIQKGNTYK